MKKIVILMIAAVMICSCGNRNKNVNNEQIDSTVVEMIDSVEVSDSI